MSNQTSKVITSDKGKFKNAVPLLVVLILWGIISLIGSLLMGLLMKMCDKTILEVLQMDPAALTEMLLSGAFSLMEIVESELILAIPLLLLKVLIGFFNISNSFVSLLMAVMLIIVIIAICTCQATLTETGIYGRNNDLRKFDLTFDRIVSVQQVKKSIVIQYVNEKGKTKKMGVSLSDPKKFADTCNEQLKAYKESATA